MVGLCWPRSYFSLFSRGEENKGLPKREGKSWLKREVILTFLLGNRKLVLRRSVMIMQSSNAVHSAQIAITEDKAHPVFKKANSFKLSESQICTLREPYTSHKYNIQLATIPQPQKLYPIDTYQSCSTGIDCTNH